jgi:hypothetical protein
MPPVQGVYADSQLGRRAASLCEPSSNTGFMAGQGKAVAQNTCPAVN